MTLPQVGEQLNFDGSLSVTVVKIERWFYHDTDEPPHRTLHVHSDAEPSCRMIALKLRDPAVLEEWASSYPMLDLDLDH
ncbi:hypothetical protein [Nocardia sp. NPDC058497]|uniref:hypothetical protein n=1 Tax=Nocardia sp. NPDC058497 TaxID=3346529 RepID=UPI00365347DC